MSNQLLAPPEIDTDNLENRNEPLLLRPLQPHDSLWESLAGNVRERLFPPQIPELQLESKPVPVWDPLERPRDRRSSLISIGIHLAVFAAIAALLFWQPKKKTVAEIAPPPAFNITPFVPFSARPASGGGGGGGDRDVLQATKGKLPKISKVQFVPPDEIIRNPKPKLAVAPTVVMPQNIHLPTTSMPNLGNPTAAVHGPLSNGTGSAGGIGSGTSGGVGSGSGAGVGPGQGGGYGGGVYHVGGGVSPPVVIYQVDPEFSDKARMAKYQGVVVVAFIVDAKGMPRDLRVVQHLGMGLDQKALEAVRKYRFRPAMLNGHPVPVSIAIDVDFHIY